MLSVLFQKQDVTVEHMRIARIIYIIWIMHNGIDIGSVLDFCIVFLSDSYPSFLEGQLFAGYLFFAIK